jgi:hypothetical protein
LNLPSFYNPDPWVKHELWNENDRKNINSDNTKYEYVLDVAKYLPNLTAFKFVYYSPMDSVLVKVDPAFDRQNLAILQQRIDVMVDMIIDRILYGEEDATATSLFKTTTIGNTTVTEFYE